MGSSTAKLTAAILPAGTFLVLLLALLASAGPAAAQSSCNVSYTLLTDNWQLSEEWTQGALYIEANTANTQMITITADAILQNCGIVGTIVAADTAGAMSLSWNTNTETSVAFTAHYGSGEPTTVGYTSSGGGGLSFNAVDGYPVIGQEISYFTIELTPTALAQLRLWYVDFSFPYTWLSHNIFPTPTPLPTPVLTGTLEPPITDTLYSGYDASGVVSGTFTLPEPIEIPDYDGPTLDAGPIMSLENLFYLIQTVRTYPVLLQRYKLLTVIMLVGAAIISFRFILFAVTGAQARSRDEQLASGLSEAEKQAIDNKIQNEQIEAERRRRIAAYRRLRR